MIVPDVPLTWANPVAAIAQLGALLARAVNDIRDRVGGIEGKALGPLESYTVATLPDATAYPRSLIYVSDETGGATIAFSDGTDWLRVQDRAVVS